MLEHAITLRTLNLRRYARLIVEALNTRRLDQSVEGVVVIMVGCHRLRLGSGIPSNCARSPTLTTGNYVRWALETSQPDTGRRPSGLIDRHCLRHTASGCIEHIVSTFVKQARSNRITQRADEKCKLKESGVRCKSAALIFTLPPSLSITIPLHQAIRLDQTILTDVFFALYPTENISSS